MNPLSDLTIAHVIRYEAYFSEQLRTAMENLQNIKDKAKSRGITLVDGTAQIQFSDELREQTCATSCVNSSTDV